MLDFVSNPLYVYLYLSLSIYIYTYLDWPPLKQPQPTVLLRTEAPKAGEAAAQLAALAGAEESAEGPNLDFFLSHLDYI